MDIGVPLPIEVWYSHDRAPRLRGVAKRFEGRGGGERDDERRLRKSESQALGQERGLMTMEIYKPVELKVVLYCTAVISLDTAFPINIRM